MNYHNRRVKVTLTQPFSFTSAQLILSVILHFPLQMRQECKGFKDLTAQIQLTVATIHGQGGTHVNVHLQELLHRSFLHVRFERNSVLWSLTSHGCSKCPYPTNFSSSSLISIAILVFIGFCSTQCHTHETCLNGHRLVVRYSLPWHFFSS